MGQLYEKKSGVKTYVIRQQEKVFDGKRDKMEHGIYAKFTGDDESLIFDAEKEAERVTTLDARKGIIPFGNQASFTKKKNEYYKSIVEFIENHEDFKANNIFYAKTEAERKREVGIFPCVACTEVLHTAEEQKNHLRDEHGIDVDAVIAGGKGAKTADKPAVTG